METARKKKFFKKKEGPSFRVFSGYNQRFFTEVNENLDKFLPETEREYYLNRYGRINEDFDYLSPIYFAAAIAFINQYKGGPTTSNFNDKAVDKYVKPNMTDNPPSIPPAALNLRRKIEFLRYIRLLLKIDSYYYPTEAETRVSPKRSSPKKSSSMSPPSPKKLPSPKKKSKSKKKEKEEEEIGIVISPQPKKKSSKKPIFTSVGEEELGEEELY